MTYIIAAIIGCVIVGLFFKQIVGLVAYKRDPIRVGQLYIKETLRKESVINEGLIPDEVFLRLAQQAYTIAEMSHSVQKDGLINVFMTNLDLYVDAIQNIMSGHGSELEEDVTKTLKEYGVKIPNTAV